MESIQRKKADLAINAIIRGLEFDQVNFHYEPPTGALPGELQELAALAARVSGLADQSRDT